MINENVLSGLERDFVDSEEDEDASIEKVFKSVSELLEVETELVPFYSRLVNNHFSGGLRRGTVVEVAGQPGTGKSCLAVDLMIGAAKAGLSVLFLSSHPRVPVVDRLSFASGDEELLDRIFVRPFGELSAFRYFIHNQLDEMIATYEPALIVIDSLAPLLRSAEFDGKCSGRRRKTCIEKIGLKLKTAALNHNLVVFHVNEASAVVQKEENEPPDLVLNWTSDDGAMPAMGAVWTQWVDELIWLKSGNKRSLQVAKSTRIGPSVVNFQITNCNITEAHK